MTTMTVSEHQPNAGSVVGDVHDADGHQVASFAVERTPDSVTFADARLVDDRVEAAAAVVEALRVHVSGQPAATLRVAEGHDTLVAALPSSSLRSTLMARDVDPRPTKTARYRTMSDSAFEQWRAKQAQQYAVAILPRFGGDEAMALAGAERSFVDLLPDGLATADTSLIEVLEDRRDPDVAVGTLWLRHRYADLRGFTATTFIFDIEIDATRRGQGWGRRAMGLVDELAAAAGDARVGLNVFSENVVATTLYHSLGFRPVQLNYDLRR